jgi:mono/diheme cytochrome c family protein
MPISSHARILWLIVLLVLVTATIVGAAPQGDRSEPTTALALSSGRDSFSRFCGPCHGVDGKGHGPVASILTTPPTDLTSVSRRNMGVFPLTTLEALFTAAARLQTAAHGSEQMPIWGPTFTAIDGSPAVARARIASLLAYIESIQQ